MYSNTLKFYVGSLKIYPITGLENPGGKYTFSLNSRLDGGGWSTTRHGRFILGKDPIPMVQEVGRAPAQIWIGAKNLISTGIRSPDRPALSESLYQLSYPGPPKLLNYSPESRRSQSNGNFSKMAARNSDLKSIICL